jgi:hypothetical protein
MSIPPLVTTEIFSQRAVATGQPSSLLPVRSARRVKPKGHGDAAADKVSSQVAIGPRSGLSSIRYGEMLGLKP